MSGLIDRLNITPDPDFRVLHKVLLRDGKPSYVPLYELSADGPVMEDMIGKKIETRTDTIEFWYRAGYDYVPCWPKVPMHLGSLVDQSRDYPIKDWETFEEYPWIDPVAIEYGEFESVSKILPDGMKIIGQNLGPFEMAQCLMGYTGLCYALVDSPDLVRAIFDRIEEIYVSQYRGMGAFESVGALVVSDDMGFRSHTLLNPAQLREYVLPIHRKLAGIAHEAGKPCILHSCGQLSVIMDEIIDYVGIDAKHSYEDAILPVEEARRLYGRRIGILGGYDLDKLCRQNEEEVRAYTRSLIEMGRDGGYALGTGNTVAQYIPRENYLAMLDEWSKCRHQVRVW